MKRALLSAVLLLSACGGGEEAPVTTANPDGAPPVDCPAADYESMVGSSLAAVTLPADLNTRIINPGYMVTKDYRPDRMNIELNEEGIITRIYCG